jgi:hypothetical protein
MHFNREDYARLRQMIDVINSDGSPASFPDDKSPIAPPRG